MRTSAFVGVLVYSFFTATALYPQDVETNADWIPVGSVPPALVQSAVEARARFETANLELQRGALNLIRAERERHGAAALRIAVVPVLADLLAIEYQILEMPADVNVDPALRIDAISLLTEIGGDIATAQVRQSIRLDRDEIVRVAAARHLAALPSDDPDLDLRSISAALRRAVDGGSETEVTGLLDAASKAARRVWTVNDTNLLDSLVRIAQGPYSGSLRRRAIEFLEELAAR